MIDEMLNITHKIKSPITFPIRGSLVRDSWPQLKKLLSRDRTITIWSGDEGISEEDLLWINDKPISYFDIEKANKQFFNKYLLYIGFYELTIVFILVLMLIYHLR